MAVPLRSTYSSDPGWTPDRVRRALERYACWECGEPVSTRQARKSRRSCRARLCASCEAWARPILSTEGH